MVWRYVCSILKPLGLVLPSASTSLTNHYKRYSLVDLESKPLKPARSLKSSLRINVSAKQIVTIRLD